MAQKIPRYTSEGKLPSHPAAPTVNPAAMTPEADAVIQAGQGLAGLGGKMLSYATEQVAEIRQAADYANRMDALNRQQLFTLDFEKSLRDRTDPDAWESSFTDSVKQKQQEWLSSVQDPQQKLMLQGMLTAAATDSQARIVHLAEAKKNEFRIANLDRVVNENIQFLETDRAYQAAVDAYAGGKGFIGLGKFHSLVEDIAVAEMNTMSYEQAVRFISEKKNNKYVSAENLPEENRRSAITRRKAWEAAKRIEDKEMQDADKLALFSRMVSANPDDAVTWNDIASSVLDAEDKIRFWKLNNEVQGAKVRGEDDPYLKGDPYLKAHVTALIDTKPEQWTPEQIWQLVDRGLGAENAPDLVDRMYSQQRKKVDPKLAMFRSRLGVMFSNGLFGKKDEQASYLTYMDALSRLDIFFTSGPSWEQSQKFFDNLTKTDVHRWYWWNESMLPGIKEGVGWFKTGGPLEQRVHLANGRYKDVSVVIGDVVQFDNELHQAVGIDEKGVIQWQKVRLPQISSPQEPMP